MARWLHGKETSNIIISAKFERRREIEELMKCQLAREILDCLLILQETLAERERKRADRKRRQHRRISRDG